MLAKTKLLLLVAALGLATDQFAKAIARTALPLCRIPSPTCEGLHLGSDVGLVRVANGGSALGFGQGLGVWVVIAAIGALIVPAYARSRSDPRLAVAAGLQLGGAVGNMADRLLLGGVTDFIQVSHLVLNVADLALVAGTVMAAGLLWIVRPEPSLGEIEATN